MTDSPGSGHSLTMTLGLLAVGSTAAQGTAEAQPVGSFEGIYDEHFPFVWRSLARLGVHDAALDDAVQETFLVVYRQLGAFEGRSTVRTWLFGICVRVAKNHRRWLSRKGRFEPLPGGLVDRSPSPLERTEQAETVRLLHGLLAQMDDKKRVVFILAELEQMTAPEIAESLGVRLNTVYSRIRAARQQFEKVLARHEGRTP